MTRPNIQIDDEVREMTEKEYEALLATGWTLESTNEIPLGSQPYACTCPDRVRNNTPKRAQNRPDDAMLDNDTMRKGN